jgi:hypothetical protein
MAMPWEIPNSEDLDTRCKKFGSDCRIFIMIVVPLCGFSHTQFNDPAGQGLSSKEFWLRMGKNRPNPSAQLAN